MGDGVLRGSRVRRGWRVFTGTNLYVREVVRGEVEKPLMRDRQLKQPRVGP